FLECSGATGNVATLDQVRALDWVQTNIHAFNSDKNSVTLSGQSTGCSPVLTIVQNRHVERDRRRFHRIICESSPLSVTLCDLDGSKQYNSEFASGCSPSAYLNKTAEYLRN
ncbi:unnamed protein product, partial [Didymodactylos carnosus]